MFRIDHKALWSQTGLTMAGLALVFGLFLVSCGEWKRFPKYIPRADVWEVVEREAAKHSLNPDFVFAIIAAESSFNARARNKDARGLMQLRPKAWETVSDAPHRHAGRWESNIAAGTAYLGFLKDFLKEHDRFSYPLLAACYRYGPSRVKSEGFQLDSLPATRNQIYKELLRGSLTPVPRPGSEPASVHT